MLRFTKLLLLILGLFGLVLGAGVSHAQGQDRDLDRQVREIALGLRCPVCQNLSVADSPSPLAVEMRGIIRSKLQAGESPQAIVRYFVSSYGEQILLDPPRQGFTLLVWLGAVVSVVGGLLLVTMRLRRGFSVQATPLIPSDHPDSPLAEGERRRYEARLDAELARHKDGGV